MKQKLLWTLAFRHVWSTSNSAVVRLVSLLSMAGIAIGVAALIVLQSFMGGFTQAIASGLTSINPPLYIYVPGGGGMTDADLAVVQLMADTISGIGNVEGFLEKPAVISGAQGTVSGAVVRGSGSTKIIIGIDLARKLSIEAGADVRIASTAGAEISGMGRVLVDTIASITIDSIADFGLEEYNNSLLIVPLIMARSIFKSEAQLTSLGAYVDFNTDPVIASEVMNLALYDEYADGGWPVYMSCIPFLAFHGNLFKALGLERMAMTIVLALITVVALLNLSSALTMIALEHRKSIGVLRAMGLSHNAVFRVAVLRGLLLGGNGAIVGFFFSWFLVFMINRFFPIELDGSVYWIDVLPGIFPFFTALIVTSATILVCVLVTIFPAFSTLSNSPSEELRYE